VIIDGMYGVDLRPRTKQPELGIRRRLEFLVRVDIDIGRMIYRDQPDLVKVRNFMKLFRDVDLIFAGFGLQR
jgi:hypothetical protein